MTPAQLKALQEYVCAVVAHMIDYPRDPFEEHRRYMLARRVLEQAFLRELPPVDLFAQVPATKPPAMPDIL